MRRVRLFESTIGREEIAAVTKVLRSGQLTAGRLVRQFERYWEKRLHRHCVMVNSGSSANLLMIGVLCSKLRQHRLKPGDEVIVPALAWPTTIWPLVQYGLVPVFVDIDPQHFCMSVEAVKNALTARTKAVLCLHTYGHPCELELIDLCRARGITLLEDSCEALGAKDHGLEVGKYGLMASYSFYFSHHLTTVEGGLLICASKEDAQIARLMRAHGWTRELPDGHTYAPLTSSWMDPRFTFVDAGYNLRPTEMAAAIGLAQLKKLPHLNHRREKVAEIIWARMWLRNRQSLRKGVTAWSPFGIICVHPERNRVRAALEARGIETRPVLAGSMPHQPGMQGFPCRVASESHAYALARQGFSVPCHGLMTDADAHYVGKCLQEVW